ncbi:MAG TPA: hypothetical protein VFS00_31775, partial [Polyangiaceae bacterium]|nr:hypothetical protein [Polyangiaceae bacterium]
PAEAPPAEAPPAESHAPRPPAPSAPEQRARLEMKRASLEATLRAGKGGLTEIRALRRVCAELGDKACYERSYAHFDRLVGR